LFPRQQRLNFPRMSRFGIMNNKKVFYQKKPVFCTLFQKHRG
jgi:hypothetical protein